MYFKDIIGQEDVKRRLINSARTGIVPHAQLFTEPGGSGAFALALAYARYLNCTGRTNEESCGQCPSCKKFDLLAHPDLHFVFPIIAKKDKKKEVCDDYIAEWRAFLLNNPYPDLNKWMETIDAGNSQPLIYAKESDEIIKKMSFRIYEANYRILFIWLPEKMNIACANKLLKIIEEPPANTAILMISETPASLLETIISRTQKIIVRGLPSDVLQEALMEQFSITAEDATQIAHLAAGNYLDAINILSLNEDNNLFLEQFMQMMRNSWAKNVKGMKTLAEELAASGREKQKNFLSYCQHLIRENFIYNFRTPELNYMNYKESSFSVKFAPFVNERNVMEIMNELALAERQIIQNVNAKMIFFDLSLKLTVLLKR